MVKAESDQSPGAVVRNMTGLLQQSYILLNRLIGKEKGKVGVIAKLHVSCIFPVTLREAKCNIRVPNVCFPRVFLRYLFIDEAESDNELLGGMRAD